MRKEEYTALKSEIMQLTVIQQSYIIAMYTITIAIVGIALQNHNVWLFLLPYIVLIPFQRIVQSKKYNGLKIAAYIAVFGDDTWEKYFVEIENKIKEKYDKQILSKKQIIRISSLHLGFLCSLMCIAGNILFNCQIVLAERKIYMNLEVELLTVSNIASIISAVLLFVFQIYWCRGALNSETKRQHYVEAFEELKKIRN
jgi:hypothetical protein